MAQSVLSGEVYRILRDRILTGELEPGAALGEKRLAAELDVSRTPLREAIRRLAEDGLVAHQPHRGARVNQLTPQLVQEVFDIRESLEGMAARGAARNLDAASLAALGRRFGELRQRVAAGDLADVGDEIHGVIFRACGNDRLRRMAQTQGDQVVWIQNARYQVRDFNQSLQTVVPLAAADGGPTVAPALRRAFREHESVLLALEARDPEWAETAIRAHIRATKRDLLSVLAAE